MAKFKEQLKRIGFSYDWQREINTTDPRYYKWTQWIFLQIYSSWFNPVTNKAEPISTYPGKNPDEVRLAYVADVPVNWCPELGTVLANEEVVDGKSEIGGFPVVRRPMRQWMLRITAYAERLLNELDKLDWPGGIKLLQRNWIGRSEGTEIDFKIDKSDQKIRAFTTRPDTLYGGTFLVLAPEHSLVDLIVTEEQWPAVREYRERTARKSDLERADLSKEKTGVFTGAYAINPATDEKIPIWIADYVLIGYGTGAIGGVPAHDERDLEFAKKFDLPIVIVVQPTGDERAFGFTGEGIAINSPVINDLTSAEAKKKITSWLEERGQGKGAVNYKLRDWLFSRQRYWGEPFPIIWENANHRSLSESELPVVPPPLEEYKPTGTGEPPLSKAKDWIRYSKKRHAKRMSCRNGPARVGTTCDSVIQTTISVLSENRPSATGWAARSRVVSICTLAARSTRSCICFMHVSGKRCCSISAMSRSRSHSSGWSIKELSWVKIIRKCRNRAATS